MVPQFAEDFRRHLRNYRRDPFAAEAFNGGTAADRHFADTGHRLYRGCCVDPVNRCAGCHKVLPRPAREKGERYCSRSCREAVSDG